MVNITEIRTMVGKFVKVVNCADPEEAAVLMLARQMKNLELDMCREVFTIMFERVEFRIFPLASEWAAVIKMLKDKEHSAEQNKIVMQALHSNSKKFEEFPDEKPTDADWAEINKMLSDFGVKHSIPAEDARPYMSPEECMIGWQKRQDELHEAIRHLDRQGLIQPGKKKREKTHAH